ncbi:Protein of unknown function [Gryllus bimaculatus]|nr:Protein of unknown function [Gryllus bimaculatus]
MVKNTRSKDLIGYYAEKNAGPNSGHRSVLSGDKTCNPNLSKRRQTTHLPKFPSTSVTSKFRIRIPPGEAVASARITRTQTAAPVALRGAKALPPPADRATLQSPERAAACATAVFVNELSPQCYVNHGEDGNTAILHSRRFE